MYVSVCVLCVCVHVCVHVLGAVHKVRHAQGGGGVSVSVTMHTLSIPSVWDNA